MQIKKTDDFNKNITATEVSGITLTNNEILDIMEVVASVQNKRIILEGTTKYLKGQEEGFIGNFIGPFTN